MIDLGTLADLLEHHHQLDAYCPRCDRWSALDLAALVSNGLGDRRLPIKVPAGADSPCSATIILTG